MKQRLRSYINRNFGTRILSKWIVLCFDIIITTFAYGVAYILRFNFNVQTISFGHFVQDTFLTAGIFTISFLIFKSYDGIIRHSGIADVTRLIKAGLFGLVICVALSLITRYVGNRIAILPASIAIIHVVLALSLLSMSRYVIKVLFYTSSKKRSDIIHVLIYGAGRRGVNVLHALREEISNNYHIVGFLDDNLSKADKTIEGVKIYPSAKIQEITSKQEVNELIISMQHPDVTRKNEIVEFCLLNQIKVKNIAPVEDWINGKLSAQQIRHIHIEDLLEREPITIQNDKIFDELNNKVIMITGAAGSIGSEIVRQVLNYQPKQLILLDQAESALYDLHMELFLKLKQLSKHAIEFVICDITNLPRLRFIFDTYKPSIVFHAAAYKHVPLMESNAPEAILVNVFGSKYLMDLSVEFGVEKFVMISTDKAVHPINIMGASKRVAEIYAQELALQKNCKTTFITTRFGNVLGSNGSVVIYFRKQIENGGPVTITHPDVTRYFMTISEACQLVLEAATMGKSSEIYLFEMGEPVKITDLAKKMVLLSGLTPEKDIKFIFTGLRPGEKLHEELLFNDENLLPTHHHKIKIARTANYDSRWVNDCIGRLWAALQGNDVNGMMNALQRLIPELNSRNDIPDMTDLPETPEIISL